MKLSELFELSPLGWEEAKRETIKQFGRLTWKYNVKCDKKISECFDFDISNNREMWYQLSLTNHYPLIKEWEAKQTKKD